MDANTGYNSQIPKSKEILMVDDMISAIIIYRIAGKFGGELNLADWRTA